MNVGQIGWGRIGLATALLASPVVLVLLALVWLDALAPLPALAALLVVVPALGAICRWHYHKLDGVIRYVRALAEDRGVPNNAKPGGHVEELGRAVDHLHQTLLAERRRSAAKAGEESVVLDSLPDPVLLLGRERRVLQANAAADRLVGASLVGGDLAMALRHPAVLEAVDSVLSGQASSREIEFTLPAPQARHFDARIVRLPQLEQLGLGQDGARAILMLHDVTDAKQTEQLRADFVSNASHELRTPLTTLLGMIETLQGPAKDDAPTRERFLAMMREHAERMARLIRDLLSLSQIEMQEHTPPQLPVDLRQLLTEVADMLRPQAEQKQMRIEISAPATPPAVGDHDQLVQVFTNLIDNALKYGRPGTPVRVTVGSSPDFGGRGAKRPAIGPALAVSVSDQGEGIPREHLPRLTERFYRVDSARSRALGGTGLGLAIVKHVVSRHRGALTIDSTPGQGSVFTVFLPAISAHPPA
jgi:two-component system phosphate regulon sensor histidine kinase PhoR